MRTDKLTTPLVREAMGRNPVRSQDQWDDSFGLAKAANTIDVAVGRNPERHIVEAQGVIEVLKQMGAVEGGVYGRFIQDAPGDLYR
jgi:hypothetical protein